MFRVWKPSLTVFARALQASYASVPPPARIPTANTLQLQFSPPI